MIHMAAWLFFALALLAGLVAIHVTVRLHWHEILAALRGELGASPAVRPSAAPARASARRHAAA